MNKIIAIIICLLPLLAFGYNKHFTDDASYQACFEPYDHCEQEIVSMINGAQNTIQVFAYSLTSWPITDALIEAKHRGVNIKMIVDPNHVAPTSGIFQTLVNYCIPIWIENKLSQTPFPASAHNKVIITDGENVEMGSYNYSKAAATRNTENLIFIHDVNLAGMYTNYWYERQSAATPVLLPPTCS